MEFRLAIWRQGFPDGGLHWVLTLLQQSQDGQFGGADEGGIGFQSQTVGRQGCIQVALVMVGQPQVIGVAWVVGYQVGSFGQVRQAGRALPITMKTSQAPSEIDFSQGSSDLS